MDALRLELAGNEIVLPIGRLYTASHLWLEAKVGDGGGPGRFRVGLSPYLARRLGEALLIDWFYLVPAKASEGDLIAEIEGTECRVEIRAPADGQLLRVNEHLFDDPSTIQTAPNDLGWLCEFRGSGEFLSAQEYRTLVAQEWEQKSRKAC